MRPSRIRIVVSTNAAASVLWVAIRIAVFCSLQIARSSFEDRSSGCRIEIPGRFVRKQKARRVDQRPGNGDPLHLAAGKLVWHAVRQLRKTDRRQPIERARAWMRMPCKQQGKLHVFNRAQRVQQLKRLKDEADFLTAQGRQLRVVEVIGGHAVEPYMTGGGKVQGPGKVQQGRFAAAAASDQSDILAWFNPQRHLIEGPHRFAVGLVVLHHSFDRKQRRGGRRGREQRGSCAGLIHVNVY